MSNVETIRVKDFTTLPGARYKEDGDGSAEEFFEKYVKEKLERMIKFSLISTVLGVMLLLFCQNWL